MSSISKIHFNSSTGVSLNDRFTIMSKVSPLEKLGRNGVANGGVFRKRSNSVDSYATRQGSFANRQLLTQLDRRHLAQNPNFRLKNRNIRSGRQRLNRNNITSRLQLRRAVGNTLLLAGGSRQLQRSNSLSDVATMNADFVERQAMRRSNSQLSIASRLGTTRSRSRGPRRPLQRTNSYSNMAPRPRSQSNSRSRSRPRMSRSRSRGNLTRARSRSGGFNAFNGTNIDGRLGRGRPRGRSLSRRGRGNLVRSGSRTNLRSGSVNNRFGSNRTNRPASVNGFGYRGRGGRGGRFAKRGQRRGAGPGQNGTGGGRLGRTPQRGGPGVARRGRSRSRGRAPSRNRGRVGQQQQRGRNASRGRRASEPAKSREQLDKELDQYMANTKSSLDKEMDDYMSGINSTV